MKKQNLVLAVFGIIFSSQLLSLAYTTLTLYPHQGFGVGIDQYYYVYLQQNECEDIVYKTRLKRLFSSIELPYTSSVRKQIDHYLKYSKLELRTWIGLSSFYFPIILKILKSNHVPPELIYLTLLESSLNPSASSPSGLTGLWQFTHVIGKMYGLDINAQIDERMDIIKSTEAVCKYFKKLYQTYNDWILVIAAYNCGGKNIQRAILKSYNYTDYQSISIYLPSHTRHYISCFIALNYLINYFGFHQIQPIINNFPMVDTITIKHKVYFDQLSTITHINKSLLHKLNPQFTKDFILGDLKEKIILIPIVAKQKINN